MIQAEDLKVEALNVNIRELMMMMNNSLGYGLFNCPRTFLVYLSLTTDIKADSLMSMLKNGNYLIV